MRSHMRLLPDAATAALYALSLAVACGIVGCMIGQTLGSGALTAVLGLLTGSAVFGGRLWRIYHPRSAFLDARHLDGQPATEAHIEIRHSLDPRGL